MISFDSRYFNYAHRVSLKLAAAVTGSFYDGQWFTLNADGEAILSAGTTNTKSFMTLSSRYGVVGDGIGAPITDAPAGRDNVTSTGMVSVLVGPFKLVTDQYETGTYVNGAALKISENGKLMPWVLATDAAVDIAGYCCKKPTATDLTIGIIHE